MKITEDVRRKVAREVLLDRIHMDWTDGEYEAYDLNDMIVGIEIVSFEPEG